MKRIYSLLDSRLWALIVKETVQLLKNKQLLVLLLVMPTIYLIIVGFSLNDDIKHIPLKLVDYSNTPISRQLVDTLVESDVFTLKQQNASPQILDPRDLSHQVQTGEITVGVVIPPQFDDDFYQKQTAEIQVMVDGVDAGTAAIVSAYVHEILNDFNQRLHPDATPTLIDPQVTILYNPRLISYWFIVPAVLGLVLTLTSSIVSTNSVVMEKETGTLEQLLMTPAQAWEIIVAKVAPLVVIMMGDVVLALEFARLVFDLPFRGNFLLFLLFACIYIFVGIGLGMLVGTLTKGHLQASLTSFFINIPLGLLAGAVTPLEAMPSFCRFLSLFNPLRYYVVIMRGVLLKGVGLEVLLPDVLVLIGFAVVLLMLSVRRLYKQFA